MSADSTRGDGTDRHPRTFASTIDGQARRRVRSLRHGQRSVVFWVGMFGLVGWSVALPTLLGTALGIYIDRRWPSTFSWTLMLLFAGLMLGCVTAWRWMHLQSQQADSGTETENEDAP